MCIRDRFKHAKEVFSQPPPLARPDPDLPFILQTDASMNGIAAVLYQETTYKRRQIISYASAKLNDAQRRWHANEQECYAVLWAMKRYCAYLDHQQFTLRTVAHSYG